MPYIKLKTNVEISKEKQVQLKDIFGKKISLLPGKSEYYLMVEIEDQRALYFQGSDAPCAILEVKLYSSSSRAETASLSKVLTDSVSSSLQIDSDRIYVEYELTPKWAMGGEEF